jgi:hypothetical protein
MVKIPSGPTKWFSPSDIKRKPYPPEPTYDRRTHQVIPLSDPPENGKEPMKRFVLSATYRQSSRVTKDRLLKDPE